MAGPFTLDVNNFVQATRDDLQRFKNEFPQDLKKEVVEATPVITGTLRRGWYDVWNGNVYSLINGILYGPWVEFGTVKMTPRAFVRRTLDRAGIIAQETLARIRSTR